MKKIFLILLFISSLFASEYVVDKEYSPIKFDAKKMIFVGVNGEFSNFSGTIIVDDNKISKIKGAILIDSINTNDIERDDHLRADDYFNISKFPVIQFDSTLISGDDLKALVNIKGISKELDFKISEITFAQNSISFKLSSQVDRQEFMLNGSMSAIISDNVDVKAEIFAVKR